MTADRTPVLVVVPAWNEETTVGSVVQDVRSHGYQVLVVDDGSLDMTVAEARRAGAVVISLPFNLGVGPALRCGFKYAVSHGYRAVAQCDADGQHPAASIDALVAAHVESGADLVVGSRFTSHFHPIRVSAHRRLTMRILASSASRATGVPITDATSGFRLFARPLLEQFARSFATDYLGDTYEALVTAGRFGYKVREIPITMRERRSGKSSASPLAAARSTVRALLVVGARQHFEIAPATHHRDEEGGQSRDDVSEPIDERPSRGSGHGRHPVPEQEDGVVDVPLKSQGSAVSGAEARTQD